MYVLLLCGQGGGPIRKCVPVFGYLFIINFFFPSFIAFGQPPNLAATVIITHSAVILLCHTAAARSRPLSPKAGPAVAAANPVAVVVSSATTYTRHRRLSPKNRTMPPPDWFPPPCTHSLTHSLFLFLSHYYIFLVASRLHHVSRIYLTELHPVHTYTHTHTIIHLYIIIRIMQMYLSITRLSAVGENYVYASSSVFFALPQNKRSPRGFVFFFFIRAYTSNINCCPRDTTDVSP